MQRAPACKVSGNSVRELPGQGQRRGHEGFPAWSTAAHDVGQVGDRPFGALRHAHQPCDDRALQGVLHTPSDLAGGVRCTAAEIFVEEAVPLCPLACLREATLCGVGLVAEALARDAFEAEGHDGAGEGGGHLGQWVCQPKGGAYVRL